MNKLVALFCMLACGVAIAEEQAQELTPAQKIEATKFLDRGMEILEIRKAHLQKQWWLASFDPKKRKKIEFSIRYVEQKMKELESKDVPFWNELQKSRRREWLQWQ